MIRHDLEPGDAMLFDEEVRQNWARGVPPNAAGGPSAAPAVELPEMRYLLKIYGGCTSTGTMSV
jgi:hypothetical protein